MKVTNIEKFRNDLFTNLQNIGFPSCSISRIAETHFERTTKNYDRTKRLTNTLSILKSHYDDSYEKVEDVELFITINDEDIDFHTKEDGYFKLVHYKEFSDYDTRLEMMMSIASYISRFIAKH